jgi:LacI family sucrose operon transcriptional repressor
MANIREVAKKAGVGVGTVSRALNNTGYVADETRQKIMEAVEELEYMPNELAKQLFRNRNGIIGVMVPNLEHPFFAKMMRYIEMELSKHDYKCLACNTIEIENRQQGFMDMLERNMVDGIITCVDPLPDFATRKGKPIVSMDRKWGPDVPIVRSDHEQGGRLAAEAFIKNGCKKVVQFCSGRQHYDTANIRHEVFAQVLRENQCEVITIGTKWDALSYAYNKSIILQYMDIITASDGIMTNDIGAMSCLAVAQKMGIRVPEELKIVGYDGTEITNLTYPELSVVVQDCAELAKNCVDIVLQMIDGKEPEAMQILVPVSWKQGGTT